ncbi:hypothetical protein SpCBS45565_g02542 [Spizellomyces sp. 'palustris']|nr:hypothetical protein SpCBS45565_g02542 [Spizellomyces sp. 'palustris']
MSGANDSSNCESQYQEQLTLQVSYLNFNSYMANNIAAMAMHILLFALLADRIIKIKHRATIYCFWTAVAFNILYCLWNVIGNSVPWMFTYAGSNFYYYPRGLYNAMQAQSLVLLNYYRVASSFTTVMGDRLGIAIFVAVLLVFPLELASQWYIAVRYTITQDWVHTEYFAPLVHLSWVYQLFLDICFCGYSIWIIRGSKSSLPAGAFRSHESKQHKAFAIAHIMRIIIFLGIEVLRAISTTRSPDDDDVSLESLTFWAVHIMMPPFKPYLIVTDMTRVRALTDRWGMNSEPHPEVSGIESTKDSVRTPIYDGDFSYR